MNHLLANRVILCSKQNDCHNVVKKIHTFEKKRFIRLQKTVVQFHNNEVKHIAPYFKDLINNDDIIEVLDIKDTEKENNEFFEN